MIWYYKYALKTKKYTKLIILKKCIMYVKVSAHVSQVLYLYLLIFKYLEILKFRKISLQ